MLPRPPWVCCWKEEFLPAAHPGEVVGSPSLVAVTERFDEHLPVMEKHNPGRDVPRDPFQPWVSMGAPTCCCWRDKLRAGSEKRCCFPAGTGKRSVVSAILFQPVFQSQTRARSVQTSVHKHAGGPCAHCWTSVACHISIPFWSLDWLWGLFPWRSHSGLAHHCTRVLVKVLDGKMNAWSAANTPSWWLKASDLPPAPPVPHLPHTLHQRELSG